MPEIPCVSLGWIRKRLSAKGKQGLIATSKVCALFMLPKPQFMGC